MEWIDRLDRELSLLREAEAEVYYKADSGECLDAVRLKRIAEQRRDLLAKEDLLHRGSRSSFLRHQMWLTAGFRTACNGCGRRTRSPGTDRVKRSQPTRMLDPSNNRDGGTGICRWTRQRGRIAMQSCDCNLARARHQSGHSAKTEEQISGEGRSTSECR